MSHCKVAILLAAYNGAAYIQEQIQSILDQSYTDFSLHIFDDCSSDNTPALCAQFAALDPRVVIHRNTINLGIVANISHALTQVEADIYFLSDQDDIWKSHKLQRMLDLLAPEETLLAFSDLELIDAQGNSLQQTFWASQDINPDWAAMPDVLALRTAVTGCTMAFKDSLLQLALPIPPGAPVHDQWLAFFAAYLGGVTYSSEQLVFYRQHGANLIGAQSSPEDQREKRYKGLQSLAQYKAKKWDDFLAIHHCLSAYAERLEQRGYAIPPYLTHDLNFYQALLDQQWKLVFKLALNPLSPQVGHSFLRTGFTALLFPLVYFFILKKGPTA